MSPNIRIRSSKARTGTRTSAILLKKLLWLLFYSLPLLAFLARGAEPASQIVQIPAPQNVPPSVIIYKSHPRPIGFLHLASVRPVRLSGDTTTVKQVRDYIQAQALEHGVNPNLALWIVKHESEFNPRAKGDREASRGLWQISKIYHPEVSDEVAFSVTSSTDWSLGRIAEGKVNEWSTYRFCRKLYRDCPF